MKKTLAVLLLMVVAVSAHAEGKHSAFWDKLRQKVETFAPQKQLGATTAVGGVRGAPSDVNDVYWKGEAVEQRVDAQELEGFKQAIQLATAGEVQQAQLAFAQFIKTYPESTLRKEAEQALAELKKE